MAEKRQDKRIKHSFRIFIFVLFLSLLVALIAVLPQFYISDIKVTGNRKVRSQDIIDVSKIEKDRHLFYYVSGELSDFLSLRYGNIEKKLLERFPYLSSVKVQVSFPYNVNIVLEEHIEIAYLHYKNKYFAIDRMGKILLTLGEKPETAAPIIEGLSIKNENIGQYIDEDTMRQVSRALLLMNVILDSDKNASDDLKLVERVIEYRPYQATALYFILKGNNSETLNVKINPSANLQASISWLRTAIKSGELDKLGKGILTITDAQKYFTKDATIPSITQDIPEVSQSTSVNDDISDRELESSEKTENTVAGETTIAEHNKDENLA